MVLFWDFCRSVVFIISFFGSLGFDFSVFGFRIWNMRGVGFFSSEGGLSCVVVIKNIYVIGFEIIRMDILFLLYDYEELIEIFVFKVLSFLFGELN